MKILGISGSPRRGGNTDILLDKALEGAETGGSDTEKIVLDDLDISPCREEEYEHISDDGFSVVDDDMQKVYGKINEADGLVLASPVFFGSVSAQMKIMVDRFQCAWVLKNDMKKDIFTGRKSGAFICVEASRRDDFFANAISIIRNFFAVINTDYSDELLCQGIEKKGDILDHPNLLDKAFETGKELVLRIENRQQGREPV